MFRSAAQPDDLSRGVYKAPYRIDGCEVLFAVTSQGERWKKIIVLRAGVSEESAVAWFEQLLDRVDPPRPALRLVPPLPMPKQLTVEEIDALYRDADPVSALLWARKRAKMLGGTLMSR